jgi:hypothetical protein
VRAPLDLYGLGSVRHVDLCRAECCDELLEIVEIYTNVRVAHPDGSILGANLATGLCEGEETTRRVRDGRLRSVLEEEWYLRHLFHRRLTSEIVDTITEFCDSSAIVRMEQ